MKNFEGCAYGGILEIGCAGRVQKMVPVATGDFVMCMLVERALQPEIAAVAGELLQFEGSEF